MEELFMGMDNRFKVSMADSTMMCILHTAMNKAHEKVRSKEGVIERLNEQSKFCELAIMQLEACFKFVQEEADNCVLESSYDKLLTDLTEIKDRLYGRLRETECALADKDKELVEKDRALEAKEKELQALRRNEEERNEGDFCELKNSVDQQVWSIKQHLEGEKMALSRRMSQGSSVSTVLDDSEVFDMGRDHQSTSEGDYNDDLSPSKKCFDQMGLEIDKLEEILDTAFGIMQSTISGSGVCPLEVQWMRRIDSNIQSMLVKEYLMNLQENLTSKGELNFEQLSDLMNDVALLRNELEGLVCSDEVGAKRLKSQESGEFVVKDDELKNSIDDDSEDDRSNLVARMIKNHESIIRTKIEELNWVRAVEMVREKSHSSSGTGKDTSCLKNSIGKVIARLGDFLKWKEKLGTPPSVKEVNNDKAMHLQYCMKIEKTQFPCIEDGDWVNDRNRESFSDVEKERRILKQQIEDLSLQFVIIEEIYNCLLKGLMKDIEIELQDNDIGNSIRECVCNELLKETVKELIMCTGKKVLGDYKLMFRLKDGIFQFVLKEAVMSMETKGTSDIMLANDQKPHPVGKISNTTSQISEVDSCLKSLMQEEMLFLYFKEMAKSWTQVCDDYIFEHHIREEVYQCVYLETLKGCHNLIEEYEGRIKGKCSAAKTAQKIEVSGKESFIQKLDLLLSDMEIEDLLMESSETKESGNLEFVSLDIKEPDILHTCNGFSLDDEATFREVSSKLEKALQQLESTKTLLTELEVTEETTAKENGFQMVDQKFDLRSLQDGQAQSLDLQQVELMKGSPPDSVLSGNHQSLAVDGHDGFQKDPDHTTQKLSFGHEIPCLTASAKEKEDLRSMFLDSEFSSVLTKLEHVAERKLNMMSSRLQKVNDQVKPLIEHIALLKEKELLYKKAFIRRCQNLRKAETEVDILGDQVDALTGLLERIYTTLDFYSPALQHFSGVLDILTWIRKELNLGVGSYKPKYVLV